MLLTACGADAGEAVAAEDAAANAAANAAACAGCHSGPLAFSGRNPAEIAGLISNISSGGKPHPPLNLSATDADSIRRLADVLTQQ
jgi:hypothetical protein